jgi:hypothetical protein
MLHPEQLRDAEPRATIWAGKEGGAVTLKAWFMIDSDGHTVDKSARDGGSVRFRYIDKSIVGSCLPVLDQMIVDWFCELT